MTTLDERSTLDVTRVDAFAQRVMTVFDDACITLLTSIGHQTGLFDTMAGLPPSSSAEVAAAAGLQERYVREWLNGMTTARFVVHEEGCYHLPPEHAACLTTAAGSQNLARLTTYVPMLAEVEPQVVTAFRDGGGVPYSAYPRFQQTMAEDSAAVFDDSLVDVSVPLVEGLPERLRDGIDVADIGCGSGHATNLLARAFPASRFVGYDLSESGVAAAREESVRWGLTNTRFEVHDVAELDEVASFDLVTAFDAIHDQAHPARVLAAIERSLRPDGVFLMVDIKASSNVDDNVGLPWGTFLYAASTLHCMTVSLAQGGDGLGTAWGEQLAVSMLADAGFTDLQIASVDTDPFNSYYVARKG